MKNPSREKWSHRVLNELVVALLKGFSYLPLSVLYGLSTICYFLIRHIFRYRKKVVLSNLKNSFPEKNDKEIHLIARKFYRHLCDLLVEGLKAYSMRRRTLERRIVFKNLALLDRYYREGKSVIIVGMHYNNWEWCSLMPALINHPLIAVYSPTRNNRAFENYLLKIRKRYHPVMVPMEKTPRMVIEFSRLRSPRVIWLLADQSPHPNTKSWIRFMNQETPFFSGPEKIAFRTKQPLVFEYVKKTGRGKYEVYHTPLFETYDGVEAKDILVAYVRKMEQIIREEPENYLWSHRRWKHTRPGNMPLITD